jgi:TetR/AcrR family transcriptional repressor of nem operon
MNNLPSPRTKIIDAGLKALLAHGYAATGLGPLLASVQVPKGSFYYFFASKEALAVAVLDAYSERYASLRRATFADASRSPLQRLRAYFDTLERDVAEQGGCLYAALAQSVPAASTTLHARVAAEFRRWEDALAGLVLEAQRAGEIDASLDPQQTAAFLIDAYEGAVVRARAGDAAAGFARFRKFALGALTAQTR